MYVLGRFSLGQNLYVLATTAPTYPVNWTTAVYAWFDEVKFVNGDPKTVEKYRSLQYIFFKCKLKSWKNFWDLESH